MTTSPLLTAPSWSADAATRIDRAFIATHTPSERAQLGDAVTVLDALTARHTPATAIDRYLASQNTFAERANAYAAASSLATLGLLDGVRLNWPDWPHPDGTPKRRLVALESALSRYVSLRHPVAATELAALEAGTASGELALICAEHITFDEHGQPWLALAGTARTAPRTVPLGRWATASILLAVIQRPTGPLLYGGRSSELAKRTSAILMSVRKTLTLAGFGADDSVAPESVRNTGARAVYDAAPPSTRLEAAAARLGIANLNLVVERIGISPAGQSPSTMIVDWSTLAF